MTGQEIQDRLDAIVKDLQTTQKGKGVEIALRDEGGAMSIYGLSSDANGVVNQAQLNNLQSAIDYLKPVADAYETRYAPVKTASETFRIAREVHQPLIDEATNARNALNAALEADQNYQTAKTNYETASQDPQYIAARDQYKLYNTSENFGNLSDARGKYT